MTKVSSSENLKVYRPLAVIFLILTAPFVYQNGGNILSNLKS